VEGNTKLEIVGKQVSLFCASEDVPSADDVCFGFVGQGIMFCLNTACVTTSHSQDKFVVQSGDLYIPRHGGTRLFAARVYRQPCQVTNEQKEVTMVEDTKTAEDWRTIFAFVEA
jgi:hypothetical protein